MIEILGTTWLRPFWLLAIPVGLLAGLLLARHATRLAGWERAVDPALLTVMRRMGQVVEGGRTPLWLPAALIAALGLALAGPALERRDLPAFRNLDAVILVVDLSPAMTAEGRLIDLLTTARLIAESAGSRQVGLIVYAGDAYLASALTTDARALGGTISLLEADIVPDPGTRPDLALALAGEVLSHAEIIAGDVVLLTDGAGLDAKTLTQAEALRAMGANVSTIAIPGAQAAALTLLANAGGGIAVDTTDPFPLVRLLEGRPIGRLVHSGLTLLVFSDLGRYLLGLALIPAFLLLPRRAV